MPTKREVAFMIGGFSAGITVPKVVPRLQWIKAVKYYRVVMRTWFKLQKAVKEEYYRIDDIIEAETNFLRLINPNNRYTEKEISFKVDDDGRNRSIKMIFGKDD